MKMIKKLAVTAAVACGTTGISAPLVPGAASAAPSPIHAHYNNTCGAGYSVIDHLNISGNGILSGTVYLTYNKSNGYNCVATILEHPRPDKLVRMTAKLRITGTSRWYENSDIYHTYVRSPYLYAPRKCIDWYGSIGVLVAGQSKSHCR